MFGGQATLPVVVRAALYYHGGTAAHHADRPYPMFMNVPGLKIIVPSTAPDAEGAAQVRDPRRQPRAVLRGREPVGPQAAAAPSRTTDDHLVPLGQAAVRRPGTDVTIVGIGLGCVLALRRPTNSRRRASAPR